MTDLFGLFQSLGAVTGAPGIFPVRKIPVFPHAWVGRDEQSLPVLIVETVSDGSVTSPIVLRNLRFDIWQSCTLSEQPSQVRRTIQAGIIRLTTDEPELQVYFFRTLGSLLTQWPNHPSQTELARGVDRLVEIFRSLTLPPATSLQGLWAELLLVRHAIKTADAVQAWHTTRRSLFDFDAGQQSVEVKSSSSGLRKHHFRLAQIQPPDGRIVYVVSLIVTPDSSGQSIPDLWDGIAAQLHGQQDLVARLSEVIAQSIGIDWQRAGEARFDALAARRSIAIFDARSLPRVGDDAAPEITDVHFTADLSRCAPLDRSALAQAGGLINILLGTS